MRPFKKVWKTNLCYRLCSRRNRTQTAALHNQSKLWNQEYFWPHNREQHRMSSGVASNGLNGFSFGSLALPSLMCVRQRENASLNARGNSREKRTRISMERPLHSRHSCRSLCLVDKKNFCPFNETISQGDLQLKVHFWAYFSLRPFCLKT